MIAFGCPITDGRAYAEFAERGIELAKEPDSKVFAYQSAGSIFRTYNLFLDLARKQHGLEALVLLHQDAEIVDPEFCSKVRKALQDPEVAIVGCGGALGVRNIAWWQASVTWASFSHRFEEMGGGEIPGFTWDEKNVPSYGVTGEVDTIDGFVIVMSPWAVNELRFDESLGKLHGYDLDLCMQARAGGKKVVTTDFRAIHHHSLELIQDEEAWVAAHMRIAEKWEDHLPDDVGADWKQRARRAEALVEVTQIQLRLADRYYSDLRGSTSWRITAPLRALGRVARALRDRFRRRSRPARAEREVRPLPEPPRSDSDAVSKTERAPTVSR
ncbi:MAG: glycosyltransferase [Solirubrobacterales bacterium]